MAQPKKHKPDPASYRQPMPVTEQILYSNRSSHYVCPRCRITLEREFTNFCDKCGQKLNWRHYKTAKQISL